MNRKDFLKKLGIGVGVAAIIPLAPALIEHMSEETKASFAIDANSFRGITMGGRKLTPNDIINIFKETGMLIYNSNNGKAPIVLSGEIKMCDVAENKSNFKRFRINDGFYYGKATEPVSPFTLNKEGNIINNG